ncbi:MAG: hypothetical protein P8P36_10160 [Akkermansiaceae bacterium]|nr:hypothetical protein [Akkermansiaceae bacterium]
MARKKQITEAAARKQELVAQLASNRQSISQSKQAFTSKLKPKNLVRTIFTRKPKAIFAGSVLASLMTTLLIKRPKKSQKVAAPKTSKQILLTWGLSLMKPLAKAWLINLAKQLAAQRMNRSMGNPPSNNNGVASQQTLIQR